MCDNVPYKTQFSRTVHVFACTMKIILILGVFAALTWAEHKIIPLQDYQAQPLNASDIKIIGGRPASVAQFPWQVAISYTNQQGVFFCGGSLINREWVLTAAHCAQGAISFTMYIGGITLAASENGRQVEISVEYIAHPDFNPANLNNDIALIHLPQPLTLSDRVRPIQLPQQHEITLANNPVTISGWGRISDSSTVASLVLNYVQLNTISNAQCASVYGNNIVVTGTLCAVGRPNHSPCNGDSGGALVWYDQDETPMQVGISSFVNAAGCESGNPSGYLRTEAYLEWINHIANVPD